MHTALSLTIRHDISVNIACIKLIDKAHRRQLSAKEEKGNKALTRQTFTLAKKQSMWITIFTSTQTKLLICCSVVLTYTLSKNIERLICQKKH